VSIKPLITARSLHFALNAVNAVVDTFCRPENDMPSTLCLTTPLYTVICLIKCLITCFHYRMTTTLSFYLSPIWCIYRGLRATFNTTRVLIFSDLIFGSTRLNGALYRRAASRILGVFMRDNSRSASCTRISIISDSVGMVVVIELYKETGEAQSRAHVPLSSVFR